MTPEKARALLDYNPSTGRFTWKIRILRPGFERIDKGWNTRFAGKLVAERKHRHGHLQIGLHCKNHMAHRLAWMIHYGEIPANGIDHINGISGDNRIVNLRVCSQSQNMQNGRMRKDNKSGVTGVYWCSKETKWGVGIGVNGQTLQLGRFTTLDEAILVRQAAERKYFGEYARTARAA